MDFRLKPTLKTILLWCFLVFLPQAASTQNIPLRKIAADNNLRMFNSSSFGSKETVFAFKENSRSFQLNQILLPLGFATVQQNQTVAINEAAFGKSVKPLLPTTKLHYRKIKTVVLDPGHGGVDIGTTSKFDGKKEKTFSYDVCARTARLLKEKGYNVVLTRTSDKKIELTERTNIANAAGADLFISIHFNSAPSHGVNGVETFILTPVGMPSTYDFKINPSASALAGNQFDELNVVLGYHLQRACKKILSTTDRGVKYSRFKVLRNLKCAGALIECGFLSNRTEAAKISSPRHRENIAKAIAIAVVNFDKTCNSH